MSLFSDPNHTKGMRRTIKVYGELRDPRAEARRRRQPKGPVRKPHAELETSVRTFVRGGGDLTQ